MLRKILLLAPALALLGALGAAPAAAQDRVVIKERGGHEYGRGPTKKVIIKHGGDRGYHRGYSKKVVIKHRGDGSRSKKVIIKRGGD